MNTPLLGFHPTNDFVGEGETVFENAAKILLLLPEIIIKRKLEFFLLPNHCCTTRKYTLRHTVY